VSAKLMVSTIGVRRRRRPVRNGRSLAAAAAAVAVVLVLAPSFPLQLVSLVVVGAVPQSIRRHRYSLAVVVPWLGVAFDSAQPTDEGVVIGWTKKNP
jgi:hypothetical protein